MKPLSEYTRSALELSEKTTEKMTKLTRSAIAKTEKIRKPSTGVEKMGTAVGCLVSIGLILGGAVQMFGRKPLWALGALLIGVISLISNHIYHNRKK